MPEQRSERRRLAQQRRVRPDITAPTDTPTAVIVTPPAISSVRISTDTHEHFGRRMSHRDLPPSIDLKRLRTSTEPRPESTVANSWPRQLCGGRAATWLKWMSRLTTLSTHVEQLPILHSPGFWSGRDCGFAADIGRGKHENAEEHSARATGSARRHGNVGSAGDSARRRSRLSYCRGSSIG
jgi:hypothetical protein